MRRERIEQWMAESLQPDRIRYSGRWMGYEVWTPVWDDPPPIGPPAFALVRGESIRLTDADEGFAVLRWLIDSGRLRDD